MDNETKRRELEKLRQRTKDELMGLVTRITALKASLAQLERKRDQKSHDIGTINAKLWALE